MMSTSTYQGTKQAEISTVSRLVTSVAFIVSIIVHLVIFLFIGGKIIIEGANLPEMFDSTETGFFIEAKDDQWISPPDPIEPEPVTPVVGTEPDGMDLNPGFDSQGGVILGDLSPIQTGMVTPISYNPNTRFNPPSIDTKSIATAIGGQERGNPQVGVVFQDTYHARQFGAILDISYSTHGTIGEAVNEIKNGFPNAMLVLTPGCGMSKDHSGHVVTGNQFSQNIEEYHYQGRGEPKAFYTAAFLDKLLRVNHEFGTLWDRAAKHDRGFVVHADLPKRFETDHEGNHKVSRTAATHHGFEFLIKQGCDVIYWMADFQDHLEPRLARDILKLLKRHDVVVILHDFDGGDQLASGAKAAILGEIANETGGKIIIGNGRSANETM
ncbi:MAG: hypothetical protein AAF571_11910 [Verrucomicrobiota bacterium]